MNCLGEAGGRGYDWQSPVTRLKYGQKQFLFPVDKGAEGGSKGRGV